MSKRRAKRTKTAPASGYVDCSKCAGTGIEPGKQVSVEDTHDDGYNISFHVPDEKRCTKCKGSGKQKT
jgi:DnaJ-class molecular chaperone